MPSLQDGHQHKPQPAISPERGGFERYNKTLGASWRHWTGDGSKPWYLVNPKIAGKWMFIPLKMVSIGIGPIPNSVCSSLFRQSVQPPSLFRVWAVPWPLWSAEVSQAYVGKLAQNEDGNGLLAIAASCACCQAAREIASPFFFGMSFWHFLTLTQADTAELWIRCQGIWHRISCTNGKHQLPTLLQSQHWLKSMLGKIYSKKHVKNKRAIHNFFRVS